MASPVISGVPVDAREQSARPALSQLERGVIVLGADRPHIGQPI